MTEPILQVDGIHTFIGQFHILDGVSLRVPTGSITVLLGRNGAGKTTTLRSIMALTPPREGTVRFEGQSLIRKRPYHVARLGIGHPAVDDRHPKIGGSGDRVIGRAEFPHGKSISRSVYHH